MLKALLCKDIWDSLDYMEGKINEVYNVLKGVRGMDDLGIIHSIGQPEIDVNLDQQKMAFMV